MVPSNWREAVAQVEKLLEKLRRLPPEADFSDVEQVLEAFGWLHDRDRGSHAYFVKPGAPPISVPRVGGRRVKRTYIRQVLAVIGVED
jgi:predicted RNA binding protein YcfA (HicA-like mRNA interferase family)